MTHARKSFARLRGALRVLWVGVFVASCTPREETVATNTDTAAPTVAPVDSALDTLIAGTLDDSAIAARRTATAPLSPLADSLSRFLVFSPATQRWFAAASRGGKMLVDIGRVDTTIGDSPVRQAAYREAVSKLAPLVRGDRLRLRGPWGSDDVTVSGFDTWSGRIVATLTAPPYVDSLAKAQDWLPAVAVRSDQEQPAVKRECTPTVAPSTNARLDAVKDSVLKALRELKDVPRIPRLANSLRDASSRISGCFENATTLMLVSLSAGDHEWVRERAFAADSNGNVRPLSVRDLRFRLHETLGAFDADEDGDDDVAVRGRTTRAGGMVVMRLVEGPPPNARPTPGSAPPANVPASRLERAAAGFAYER